VRGSPDPAHSRPKVSRITKRLSRRLETFGRPFRRGRETYADRVLLGELQSHVYLKKELATEIIHSEFSVPSVASFIGFVFLILQEFCRENPPPSFQENGPP